MAAEYRIQISIQLLIAAHVTFGMDPLIFGAFLERYVLKDVFFFGNN